MTYRVVSAAVHRITCGRDGTKTEMIIILMRLKHFALMQIKAHLQHLERPQAIRDYQAVRDENKILSPCLIIRNYKQISVPCHSLFGQ